MEQSTIVGPNKGPPALAVCIVFTALALIIVILRLFTRLRFVRNTGPDDLIIIIAMGLSIALTVLIWLQVEHGMGQHFKDLAPGEFPRMLKPFWASVPIYNLSLTLTKVSILLQYLRVFPTDGIRRASWIGLAFISIYGLWSFFGAVFMCWPINFFWDKAVHGRCLNEMAFWFSNAGLNILSDIFVLVLPMPVLNSLKLPTRQKIGLMLVFAVGGFVAITSILRLHSLYIISISKDITWDNVSAATWSSVEANVGITCASLPALKALLIRLFPGLGSSRAYNSSQPLSTFREGTTIRGGLPKIRTTQSHHHRGGFGHHSQASSGGAYAMGGLERLSDEELGMQPGADDGIKVVTVVAQEVSENRRDKDSESQKNLVWTNANML
ncbi:hypothetical protein MMC20_004054 [Loxospora ochrophaea]|nr:hypothetical protein [Loxospora ochrophaea]